MKKNVRETQRHMSRLNTPRNSTQDKLFETKDEHVIALSLYLFRIMNISILFILLLNRQ